MSCCVCNAQNKDVDPPRQTVQSESLCKTLCGTPEYIAPEVLIDNRYQGKISDIWCALALLPCRPACSALSSTYVPRLLRYGLFVN